jgi:hypothetical protein
VFSEDEEGEFYVLVETGGSNAAHDEEVSCARAGGSSWWCLRALGVFGVFAGPGFALESDVLLRICFGAWLWPRWFWSWFIVLVMDRGGFFSEGHLPLAESLSSRLWDRCGFSCFPRGGPVR